MRNLIVVISDYCSYWILLTWFESMLSKDYAAPDVAVKYIPLGVSTFLYQMTQIRQRRMINVIAWVIAGLIDGWPLLVKSLWQIMYFSSQEKEKKYSGVGRKAPRQVGAILTVPSVMCVTSKLQLLWAVLRLIPAHVKRQPLTSGELPARREIIHF